MKRILILAAGLVLAGVSLWLVVKGQAAAPTPAAPQIYTSPISGGCYLSRRDRCSIHVEPYPIAMTAGAKMVMFQVLAERQSGGSAVLYTWKPDV